MTNLGYGFYPTHPGEVLKDELEARGISQRKFADSIGMGYSVLNEILNGHRSLSTTSALIFEAALDIPRWFPDAIAIEIWYADRT